MAYRVIGLLVAILAILGGLWGTDHYMKVVDLKNQEIKALQEAQTRTQDDLAREREWSADRQKVIADLLVIRNEMAEVRSTIEKNDRAARKALQELKENDKEVRDYLAQPVPASVGVLYKREATTDPAKYRSGGSVPAKALPAPGP